MVMHKLATKPDVALIPGSVSDAAAAAPYNLETRRGRPASLWGGIESAPRSLSLPSAGRAGLFKPPVTSLGRTARPVLVKSKL